MGMLSFAFFSVVISIDVAWNFILVWVSVIFGLILYLLLGYIFENIFLSFACLESLVGIEGLYLV